MMVARLPSQYDAEIPLSCRLSGHFENFLGENNGKAND
jgi:hypothetical protein